MRAEYGDGVAEEEIRHIGTNAEEAHLRGQTQLTG